MLYVVLLCLVLFLMYRKYNTGSLTDFKERFGHSIEKLMYYFTGETKIPLHKYTNGCLTTKPYGFPGTSNMNKYWSDRVKTWAIEYSPERIRGDINKVRSYDPHTMESSAQVLETSSDTGYYHNPELYCKEHPDSPRCPNYWLAKEPGFQTYQGNKVYNSPDMSMPSMIAGDFGHIKDTDIDDNYHTRSK